MCTGSFIPDNSPRRWALPGPTFDSEESGDHRDDQQQWVFIEDFHGTSVVVSAVLT